MTRRVLIVGAGTSGLSAAIEAAIHGGQVTVVEREPGYGGNGYNSTGMIRGSGTWLQEKLGIEDSYVREFEDDWENSGHSCDPVLVARLARNSRSALAWLRRLDVKFKEDGMAFPPRTAVVLPDGSGLVEPLYSAACKLGAQFIFGTRMTRLIKKSRVEGIEAVSNAGERLLLDGYDAVISCSGGAQGPRELLEPKLAPMYNGLIFVWGLPTGGKGDALRAIEEIGGGTTAAGDVLTNASVLLDKELEVVGGASSSLRHAAGAIILNQDFERFANEDLTYNLLADKVAHELQRRKERWVWIVWDSSTIDRVPRLSEYPKTFGQFGLIVASSISDLAEKMNADEAKVERTIETYNRNFQEGLVVEPAQGRPILHSKPLERPPFFAFRVGIACSSLKGGVAINTQAQVLNRLGVPIPGLFAAGEDVGGFFGAGYLTGESLEHSVVYGRIAGENAATGFLGAAERQESAETWPWPAGMLGK